MMDQLCRDYLQRNCHDSVYHGAAYLQRGHGGLGAVLSRILRLAAPVVRLLVPHVMGGLGELIGLDGGKEELKGVLKKHSLRAADDVIQHLKRQHDSPPQHGQGLKRQRLRRRRQHVYKESAPSASHPVKKKRRRTAAAIKQPLQERDIFG